jgi:hypothetical protein
MNSVDVINLEDVFKVIYNRNTRNVDRLSILFEYVAENRQSHNLDNIDILLDRFEPCFTSEIVSTGLLKCTKDVRHKVNNWVKCRDSIIEDFIAGNIDYKHKLRNLLND